MIRVTVKREPGDRPGPDIVDPLIGSEAVAVERGRKEIDTNCSSRQIVTMRILPRAGLRVNRLIEVQSIKEPPWRGLITEITYSAAGGTSPSATMTIKVEREARL